MCFHSDDCPMMQCIKEMRGCSQLEKSHIADLVKHKKSIKSLLLCPLLHLFLFMVKQVDFLDSAPVVTFPGRLSCVSAAGSRD